MGGWRGEEKGEEVRAERYMYVGGRGRGQGERT